MKKANLISLWSGPRNVSTALMYAFGERLDTVIVDEPLYAYYLTQSGADHPGREEVLAAMYKDPSRIWLNIPRQPGKYTFIKNMAHHAVKLENHWYEEPLPVILIRDPKEMLPSLTIQLPGATLQDTGLKRQSELFTHLEALGKEVVVLDSKLLLLNPEKILRKLCLALSMPFDRAMLSWKAGKRTADGIWAKHWYHRVHASTGFQAYQEKRDPFPARLVPLLEECQPYYNQLFQRAIT